MGRTILKPKLLFVYDHKYPEKWEDGLWAALNLLEKDFEIMKHNLSQGLFHAGEDKGKTINFILGWGGFNSPVDKLIRGFKLATGTKKTKFGLCIAGNAFPAENTLDYDVLFYETDWYRREIKFHPNIVHAFGVNTDIFFKVNIPYPIIWDYIGVGAFAKWKRWEKMLEKKGNRLVIGEYQTDNENESLDIVKSLVRGGVMTSGMVNPFDLANLLNYARTAYVPADIYGGGERSVLEARAVGLQVEVEKDNPKLEELLKSPIWDHHYYAEQLKKGIMKCLK